MSKKKADEWLRQRNEALEKETTALSQSLDKYRQLVENINEVLFALDKEGKVTFVSANVEQIGGYRPEEIIGRLFTDFVHPEDQAERFKSFQEIFSGKDQVMEYRFVTRKGEPRWIRSHSQRILQNGEVVGMQGLLFDITDRKRFEAALQQSERKFRDIFDNSGDAILIHDLQGRFLETNEVACRRLGYMREELRALTLTRIVHPKTLHLIPAQLQELEQNAHAIFETVVWGSNGMEIPVEVSSRKIEFEGKPCYLSLVRDITRRLEKEIEYAQVLKTSIDGFWVINADEGRLLEANPAAANMLGYTKEEMLDLTVGDIDALFTIEKIRQHINHIRENGSERFETQHRQKDGKRIDVDISASYLPHSGGHLLVFIRDITERKQAEVKNAQLQAQVHQSQKLESVGRLAGGVAHDLNNLLSPILGYSELLLDETAADDKRKPPLQHILEAGGRARSLVRQLLAFSRQQMLEITKIDLNALLNNFEKLMRHTLREDIGINLSLADSLPAIKGDSGQVEQVLMNLVINAQDAMPTGGRLTIETARVELDEAYAGQRQGVKAGAYVLMAVSDTGHGMDAETSGNIFEPFFTTKDKEKGTGLGLSTAYGIVKQHGGNIWVYSESGFGTTVKVYLPVSCNFSHNGETEPKKVLGRHLKGTETILLVEDEEMVRDLVINMLEQQGYKALAAEDGQRAIELLREEEKPIDLLLTDVVMPDMNGRELYTKISDFYQDLKVIYMSGYTENVIAHHGVLDPGVFFIQKPFSVADLALKIREVMDQ